MGNLATRATISSDDNTNTLKTYQELINRGFEDNISFIAANKHPHNLQRAANYILENQNDDEQKQNIKTNKEYQSNIKECKSIKECISINRIIKWLIDISQIDILKTNMFNANNYKYLINDFHHILLVHLNDKYPTAITENEFLNIYDYMMDSIQNKCTFNECMSQKRNNRNREKQNICLSSKKNKNANCMNIDKEHECLVDLIDNIHTYFFHSYDVGFRIPSNQLNIHCDDHENKQQVIMTKLKQIIKQKRKFQRTTNCKFITTFDDNNGNNGKTDGDEQKNVDCNGDVIASYSYGHRYTYWKNQWWDDQNDAVYIQNKYYHLYEEITNNKIHCIDKKEFEITKNKSHKLIHSHHCKKLIADEHACEFYNIKQGRKISVEHIMALCLYTSYDSLSKKFSETFRSLTKAHDVDICSHRNKEYAIFSQLLCEAVNVYGTKMRDSGIKSYYHGINRLLLFDSFVTSFNCPISTSPQLLVAAIFATQNGSILELARNTTLDTLRYFNCSWLSSFAAEGERLFIMPPNAFMVLKFVSIRCIQNTVNYGKYIHAMTTFDHMIDNDDIGNKDHKIEMQDINIINQLLAEKSTKNDNYPLYVKKLFDQFIKNKKKIIMKLNALENEYVSVVQELSIDIRRVSHITNIFENCQQICFNLNEGCNCDIENIKLGNISSEFIDDIINEIELVATNQNYTALDAIFLFHGKFDKNTLFSARMKLLKQNWQIQQAPDLHGNPIMCFQKTK
eukprot:486304_1